MIRFMLDLRIDCTRRAFILRGMVRLGRRQIMHRKSLGVSLALALAAIVATTTVTAAADHWLGTWKLNLARSKYNPPELAPKSQTVTREAVEGGMKLVSDGIDAQGKPTHNEYTAKF